MWRRRKTDPEPSQGLQDARAARRQAEADLSATVEKTPEFKALADRLREMRERNHFAASIRESMRPR